MELCTFVKPDFRYRHQQEETPNTHLWLSTSFPLDPVCQNGFMGTLSLVSPQYSVRYSMTVEQTEVEKPRLLEKNFEIDRDYLN